MTNKNAYFGAGLTLVILVVGFIFGKFESIKSTVAAPAVNKDERLVDGIGKTTFINPLLDCGDFTNISNHDIDTLKQGISDFVDEQKTQGVIDDAAIYFRDLNNGPWFGIKEKDKFLPASLLKVPLMLSFLKEATDQPDLLDKKFVYQGGSRNNEYFKASQELENNHTYTLDEALSYMIKYSDNNSSHVLSFAISTDTLLSSYQDLGIQSPDQPDYAISARIYASFFRILYNSTFLSKQYSEKALRLLSETAFDQGIVAGLPPSSSIKVAHKFGERKVNTLTKQLHDCGIVYYPGKPYLLCIMTRGGNFDQLATFISQVSKKVYDSIDQGGGVTSTSQ